VKLKDLNSITSNLSVLYVENDIMLREQNSEFFKQLFKSVKMASDGEEAIKLYEKNSFDIVITGVNVPKINGLTMIKIIQQKDKNQRFLITTVYKEEELKEQLKALNLKYFLTKPIPTKRLLEKIEDIINDFGVVA
jgi:YesN/AraC family two-component response regulator